MGLFDAQTEPRPKRSLRKYRVLILLGIAVTAVVIADPFGFMSGRTEGPPIRIVRLVAGLEYPWGLTFLPNGDMLVTERVGRLRIIRGGKLDETWIPGVPQVVEKAQAGLMDVAIHPRFAENGFVYLTYSKQGQGDTPALLRARYDGSRLVGPHDI